MIYRFTTRGKYILLFLGITLLAGCGTISSNTVQLSVELTNRIKDIETSHRAFINTYFDNQVAQIDKFMKEKWTPLFLKNFLGTSQILNDLKKPLSISQETKDQLAKAAAVYLDDPSEADKMADEIAQGLNNKRQQEAPIIGGVVNKYVARDKINACQTHLLALLQLETPAHLIIDFAEAANEQIQARHQSLLEPIEQARKSALSQVTQAYQDFYAGQGILTARLLAAAARNDQQAKLIDSIGGEGTAAKLNKRLNGFAVDFNKAFSALNKLSGKKLSSQNAEDIINNFQNDINKAQETHQLK